MRRFLLVLVVLLAVAASAGLWWLVRRSPGQPQEDEKGASFSVQIVKTGWVIQHLDEQIPLRAIRWLPARGEGILVAQLLTQNDEQQVHLFREGKLQGSWRIERPESVDESFFRFAELQDAFLFQEDRLLLLYRPGTGTGQVNPLLACLDLKTGAVKWSLRLDGSYLAPAVDPKDLAVYVWGSQKSILRIPLAGLSDKAPTPTLIELPPETPSPLDFLATGVGSFLLAHAKGLSAFAGAKGWIHHPLPDRPVASLFFGQAGKLARSGSRKWWQPFIGALYEVESDGEVLTAVQLGSLPAGESFSRDVPLLRLLGCDGHGDLWFGLAVPQIREQERSAAPPDPGSSPEAPGTKGTEPGMGLPANEHPPIPAPPQEEDEAMRQHLAKGLARLYKRPANGKPMHVYDWHSLWKTWPETFGQSVPQGDADLRPECGFVLVGSERKVWWLPLSALGEGQSKLP